MKNIILLTISIYVLITLVACSNDDQESITKSTTTNIKAATSLTIKDVSNFGNGRDIELTFNKAGDLNLTKEFRIYVVKSDKAEDFDTSVALSIPIENYLVIETSALSEQILLTSKTTDIDGELVQEGISYTIFILTKSFESSELEDLLSGPSNSIILEQKNAISNFTIQQQDMVIGKGGGITLDDDGNIYIGSTFDHTRPTGNYIYKISPIGEVDVVTDKMNGISGMEFDNEGNLYVANYSSKNISKITPDGEVTVFAEVNFPRAIIFDGVSNFYVTSDSCDYNTVYVGSYIKKIDMAGNVSTFGSRELIQFGCPIGIGLDSRGNLYVAHRHLGTRSADGTLLPPIAGFMVVKIDPQGNERLFQRILPQSQAATSLKVEHLVIHDDIIYLVVSGNHSIYTIDMNANINRLVGSSQGVTNGGLDEATLSEPYDLAISPDGSKLYVTSTKGLSAIIRVIDLVE